LVIYRLLILALVTIALVVAACGDDDQPSATPTAATSASTSTTLAATNGGIVPPSSAPTSTFIYSTAAADNERVVALTDSGFTADLGEISGAVVLHNRNRSEAAIVQYSVTPLYGGTEGTTTNHTVVLLPDQEVGDAFSATYPTDAQGASPKISVLLPSARWVPFTSTERLTATLDSSGEIAGTVANPFDQASGPLRMSVVARKLDGQIIDGQSITLDSIAARGSADFEIPLSTSIAGGAVYVSFADDLPAWAAP
jgi:hypothetical protein